MRIGHEAGEYENDNENGPEMGPPGQHLALSGNFLGQSLTGSGSGNGFRTGTFLNQVGRCSTHELSSPAQRGDICHSVSY